MPQRFVSGQELLDYLRSQGFVVVPDSEVDGNVLVAKVDNAEDMFDEILWTAWANIPIGWPKIPPNDVNYVLKKAGLNKDDFWNQLP